MVAVRKNPVVPVPPNSRTPSSQALPRAVKARPVPASNSTSNSTLSSKETSTAKSKHQKSPKNQNATNKPTPKPPPSSFLKRLYLVLLSAFSIYALTICRTDHSLSSPVCRSLYTYRTHVLEPYLLPPLQTYVVPPIRAAAHHPAVQPHLAALAALEKTTLRPALASAHSAYDAHLAPAFTHHVLPLYQHYLVHALWRQTLRPHYRAHVHPHLRPALAAYHAHVAPRCAAAADAVQVAYAHARPRVAAFIVLARRHAAALYASARPYVLRAYARGKPYALALAGHVRVWVMKYVARAGEARRLFVDPHVRRIWDKVGEATRESTHVPVSSEYDSERPTVSVESTIASASSVLVASVHPAAAESGIVGDLASSAKEAALSETLNTVPTEAVSSTADSQSSTAAAASSAASSASEAAASPAPAPETPPPSASSSVTAPTEAATETEIETAASGSSIMSASLHPSSSAPAPPLAASAVEAPVEVEFEELDDFLRQIGLEESVSAAASQQVESSSGGGNENAEAPAALGDKEPTPEEREAETAAKRADIVGRHVEWQARLDALAGEREAAFRAALGARREQAVGVLGVFYKDKGRKEGEEGVVDYVEAEAGRLVKGLEGYLRKVEGGLSGGGDVEREKEKWEKVVEKVEERFGEKVREVQGEVHQWYLGVREGEQTEILVASAEVKALAEKAQADIGLDYAWLDDVTYYDWQKYHDLMRTSERFADTLYQVQNGTHASPPGDVLVDALNALEAEFQDVVRGFAARLRDIGREAGAGVFAPRGSGGGDDDSAVEGGEAEPRVSILPVGEPRVHGEGKTQGKVGAEHLFVGRDREEVVRNLEGVEVEERRAGAGAADHVEL